MTAIQPIFRIEESHDGAITTVRAIGELDVASAPQLRDCLHALAADGHVVVVVDAAELDFIDSTGVGALVAGHKQLKHEGGALVLKNPSARVVKVLALTGLDKVFDTI
jgi:anti-sigma B factor antagonist